MLAYIIICNFIDVNSIKYSSELHTVFIQELGLFFCAIAPHWDRASSFTRFLDHTEQRTTVGTTSLGERSARRRDLYLTTHNTHNRQTSMHPLGFESIISVSERPQASALDRSATGTSTNITTNNNNTQAAKCTSQNNHINLNFNHSIINCVYVLSNSVNIYRKTSLSKY